MERLAVDWASGVMRFDQDGELLLAAHSEGLLAGIGGITLDPVTPGMLCMRRFYIRPAFRRQGIGRRLAAALLRQSKLTGLAVTVNAGAADAPAFWEALGFTPDAQGGPGRTGRTYPQTQPKTAMAPCGHISLMALCRSYGRNWVMAL